MNLQQIIKIIVTILSVMANLLTFFLFFYEWRLIKQRNQTFLKEKIQIINNLQQQYYNEYNQRSQNLLALKNINQELNINYQQLLQKFNEYRTQSELNEISNQNKINWEQQKNLKLIEQITDLEHQKQEYHEANLTWARDFAKQEQSLKNTREKMLIYQERLENQQNSSKTK
jgi:hypothetical protein